MTERTNGALRFPPSFKIMEYLQDCSFRCQPREAVQPAGFYTAHLTGLRPCHTPGLDGGTEINRDWDPFRRPL